MSKAVTVAVVQAAPILVDQRATVAKTIQLIREAAARGARLILFPEAFITGYPRGLSFGAVVARRKGAIYSGNTGMPQWRCRDLPPMPLAPPRGPPMRSWQSA